MDNKEVITTIPGTGPIVIGTGDGTTVITGGGESMIAARWERVKQG